MLEKKLRPTMFFILICFLHSQINASGDSKMLKIFNQTNKRVTEHPKPFVHDSLGPITWTDTTISILSQTPITPCNDVLPIQNKDDCSYKDLKGWLNQNVNAYLIPWPKKLGEQKKDSTQSPFVAPIEKEIKTFISSSKFALFTTTSGISLIVRSKNMESRAFPEGHSHKEPFYNFNCDNEVNIFFNRRYLIICYNQPGFEITNIAQLNGFRLDLKQRNVLLNSKIYLWKYEDKPIEIKVSNNEYSLLLKQNLTESILKKLLYLYKWPLLLCAIGVLGCIMIARRLLCTIKN